MVRPTAVDDDTNGRPLYSGFIAGIHEIIVCYLLALAAAVSAIASGSQHMTMRAINQPRADFLNAEPR